jgi:hypothetical protein
MEAGGSIWGIKATISGFRSRKGVELSLFRSWHGIGFIITRRLLKHLFKIKVMKNILLIIGIATCFAVTSCTVDGYVSDQPGDVVYTRPAAPGDGYIWIDGDWVWSGGGYHWHNGYWGRPRTGHTWTAGHWDHGARGYHWNRGHW